MRTIHQGIRLGRGLLGSLRAVKIQQFSNRPTLFSIAKVSMSTRSYSLDLSGVFPPIVTSFKENEDIAYEEMEGNLKKWSKIAFKGLVVQGTNGEFIMLSPEERVDIVRFVRKVCPEKLLVAGSGCESTRATIAMSNAMADAGANALLVINPSFFKGKMTSEALENHYTKVADQVNAPIIIYNMPGSTGIDIPVDCIVRLSKHKNVIGLKDSGGNITRIGHIIHKTADQDFQVLAGSASYLLPALTVGAVGGVCALANVLGNEVCQLQSLYEAGKMADAKELQLKLIEPNTAVTSKYTVPGLKEVLNWYGYYGGPCRSPLQPMKEMEMKDLKKMFTDNGYQPN